MKLDLLGGSYQAKYKELNAQKTINWYTLFSSQQEANKNPKALYPFPGLTMYANVPGRFSRGLYTAYCINTTRCFAVVDCNLFEILPNGSYNLLAALPGLAYGKSKVYMTSNSVSELGIWHYSASYVFNLLTNTLTPVTSTQFPGQVTHADYLNTYTIVVSDGAVWESAAGSSALNWIGTQTYTGTFTSAPVIAAVTIKETIFTFTSNTLEIFYNDGQTPYSRQPRSTMLVGLVCAETAAKYNDSVVFLGRTADGEQMVFTIDAWGSTLKPISTSSITWQLNSLGYSLTDSYAYIQYSKDGQIFYYLTCPELGTTFVYNLLSGDWSERKSLSQNADSNGDTSLNCFRGRHYTNFNGKHLFADTQSGAVFIEDFTNQTENSQTILRQRSSQTFNQEFVLITVSELELDCDVGFGDTLAGQGAKPVIMLEWSKDGGMTWHNMRNLVLGLEGHYNYRTRLRKLGSGRNLVIRLTVSDPINLMIQSATAHGDFAKW